MPPDSCLVMSSIDIGFDDECDTVSVVPIVEGIPVGMDGIIGPETADTVL